MDKEFVYEIIEINNKFHPKIFINKPSMYHNDYWTFISKELIEFTSEHNGFIYCRFDNWEDAYTTLDNFRKMKSQSRSLIDLCEYKERNKIRDKERADCMVKLRTTCLTRRWLRY